MFLLYDELNVVRGVAKRDGGEYECQISTQQKMSRVVRLNVLGEMMMMMMMTIMTIMRVGLSFQMRISTLVVL